MKIPPSARRKAANLTEGMTAAQVFAAAAILYFLDHEKSEKEFLAVCQEAYRNYARFF